MNDQDINEIQPKDVAEIVDLINEAQLIKDKEYKRLDRMREWRRAHQEHIREYKQAYYSENKEHIALKAALRPKETVYCEICDKTLLKRSLRSHLYSTAHQNRIQMPPVA